MQTTVRRNSQQLHFFTNERKADQAILILSIERCVDGRTFIIPASACTLYERNLNGLGFIWLALYSTKCKIQFLQKQKPLIM